MRSLADWLEQQQKAHPSAIDMDLARVRQVADRLGLLAPAYRVVTVAGTNGKGSTVAYLDALFSAVGLRAGRFTSPHLTRYNERICVAGVEASDAELIDSFERIDAARGAITLTFFEYNALAALDHFRRSHVEFAVLEVGLGGRLDATNIIDADVGVVCSIGLDHLDWLGASLEDIGREKAGIFRRGRPAVLGSAEMPRSVWKAIEDIGAVPIAPARDYRVDVRQDSWDFECRTLHLRELPWPALRGTHQLGNAATALAAITAGFDLALTHGDTARALRSTRLAGRFQIVPGDVEWVLDVAHNVPAAEGLSANLAALSAARRTFAVCGILGDKDIAGITRALDGNVDAWILVTLDGPRAVSTTELGSRLPEGARIEAHASDVARGCAIARNVAQPGDRIVVFGSFLTVGPALEFLGI